MKVGRRTFGRILVALAVISVTVSPARAIEVGEPAPDFRLPSTFGNDISSVIHSDS